MRALAGCTGQIKRASWRPAFLPEGLPFPTGWRWVGGLDELFVQYSSCQLHAPEGMLFAFSAPSWDDLMMLLNSHIAPLDAASDATLLFLWLGRLTIKLSWPRLHEAAMRP